MKSKKEGPKNVTTKKAPKKVIVLDTASLSYAQEDEEDILKFESDVQVYDDIEQPKDENKEFHVVFVHVVESSKENKSGGVTLVTSSVGEEVVFFSFFLITVGEEVVAAKEEEERLMNEENSEEKIEEKKGKENKSETD